MNLFVILADGVPHSAYASESDAIKKKETLGGREVQLHAVDVFGLEDFFRDAGDASGGSIGFTRRR